MSKPMLSTDAEIDALEALFGRLAGFDDTISLERFDACLAALVCVPHTLVPDDCLPGMFGEAWGRTFADPDDVAQALATLRRRWFVVESALDLGSLLEEPDQLRLAPLMANLDPGERDRLFAAGEITAEEAADWPGTGELWAQAFLDGTDRMSGSLLSRGDGSDDAKLYRSCRRCLEALTERDEARLRADLAERYPGRTLTRDELIEKAMFAVQDLRLHWFECSLRPAPRRVERPPGRNDPCPCGSGRKFKKCHGAPGAAS